MTDAPDARPSMREVVADARAQVEAMTDAEVTSARNAGLLDERLHREIAAPEVTGVPCVQCKGTGCMYWRISVDEYDMDACDECGGTGEVDLRSPAEVWRIVDIRTGKTAGVSAYFTREQALASIAQTRRNVERGRRPDLADVIDHLDAVQLPRGTE